MKEFYVTEKPMKLSAFLGKVCPEISYSYLRILLRMHDVKVNGKRIGEDIRVNKGDLVQVYAQEGKLFRFVPEILFENKDFLICNKPRGTSSEDYCEKVKEYYNEPCVLCHRLDTNTQGVLIIARNKISEQLMAEGIKNGFVKKFYKAVLCGIVEAPVELSDYLLKDAEQGIVTVVAKPQKGAMRILTNITPIEKREDTTLAEIELLTGKTHQIRAHTAFIGHPVLGDPKYGDFSMNRAYKAKKQYLTAAKLSFDFPENSSLSYLNAKKIEIKPDFD